MINNFDVKKLDIVPHKPGCYLWKNKKNKIIYIGKARDLNKRMHQYFNKSHNNRIYKLTSEISSFDYIVVNDENEALVLENNLIKTYKPRFNVLLKEGSNNYPYILVTNNKHPKIIYTRRYNPSLGKYYGPFASSDNNPYELFIYLNRIIPLRKCNVVPKQKCMYYDLGQCLGPCIKNIDQTEYDKLLAKIDDIFQNKNNKEIINELKQKELIAAENLDFEQANYYLKIQNSFESIIHKQIVQLKDAINADYIGYFCDDENICINIFNYIDGKLITKHSIIEPYYGDVNESIISYLMQYYSDNKAPKSVYLVLKEDELESLSNVLNIKFIKPIKGKHLDLLTQSVENARYFLITNKANEKVKINRTVGACEDLAKLLNIDSAYHIEMIDNSNIFLESPVSAVVVFQNGIAQKKLYRKYNLDYMQEKSDFHFMKEVIERRFAKLAINDVDLPDVFIVDGGKIQLNAALDVFKKLNISDRIKVIGLEKNEHHKTNCIVTSDGVIELEKTSNVYKLLFNIQEEVHRFAISYFRDKNLKSKLSSILDDIKGIGIETKQKILKLYPNLAEIRKVNVETLQQIMPKKVAIALKDKVDKVFNHD